jgi:transposase
MDDHVDQGDVSDDGGAGAADVDLARATMAGVFRIPDEMWERIEPLVPVPEKVHRFGGGRPRVPDRQVLDGIFFVLRTGCQWHALDATGICNGATAHRRFQEWERQGFFEALWQQALCDYDAEVGIDWAWLSIDGAMGKARWEAGARARTRPIAASSESSAA